MVMTNFLQSRKSVRDFKDTTVHAGDITDVRGAIAKLHEEDPRLKYDILSNGKLVFDNLQGKAGYSGVMIEAPHYVSVAVENVEPQTLLSLGYGLEKLNTKLIDTGLDTCWITLDEVDAETKKTIFGEGGENVIYLIAFGYAQGKKLFTPETTSGRKEVSEIVFDSKLGNKIDAEELENRGLFEVFSSVRYAPSHKNFQPWRFVINNSNIDLYMLRSDEDSRSLVDMGVVMFYFEEMAKTIGVAGKWNVNLKEAEDYLFIGSFVI